MTCRSPVTLAFARAASAALLAVLVAATPRVSADDGQRVLSIDHYVTHESTVPAIDGELTQLYVRERVQPATVLRGGPAPDRVVLFVHGAGTPAEVAFDVPFEDYSWMAYLAEAGYDVFSVDMTGYGRSARPSVMNDVCNLSPENQAALRSAAPCAAKHDRHLTTVSSDWDDIDAVVEYIRRLRGVERVSLIGWSLGGPRAGGYAARHPEKVEKLVLLAPAYSRDQGEAPATPTPAQGVAFNTQTRAEFLANWQRQAQCPNQYDPRAAEVVWAEMLRSDPVGATWGPGVRRAPNTTVWGWGRDVVQRMRTPTLLVAAIHDLQVTPDRVQALYEDLGAEQKVLVDLGCSSHAAMWERNHLHLFRASLEWLRAGTVDGMRQGVIKLGY
jgi:pimeloyl-ACP methyl ester carboxylesterase